VLCDQMDSDGCVISCTPIYVAHAKPISGAPETPCRSHVFQRQVVRLEDLSTVQIRQRNFTLTATKKETADSRVTEPDHMCFGTQAVPCRTCRNQIRPPSVDAKPVRYFEQVVLKLRELASSNQCVLTHNLWMLEFAIART
jgi:hypothetical protein